MSFRCSWCNSIFTHQAIHEHCPIRRSWFTSPSIIRDFSLLRTHLYTMDIPTRSSSQSNLMTMQEKKEIVDDENNTTAVLESHTITITSNNQLILPSTIIETPKVELDAMQCALLETVVQEVLNTTTTSLSPSPPPPSTLQCILLDDSNVIPTGASHHQLSPPGRRFKKRNTLDDLKIWFKPMRNITSLKQKRQRHSTK